MSAASVLFDQQPDAGRPQHPAAHLAVPAVEVAAAQHHRAAPAQGVLQRPQPLVVRRPGLGPDGDDPRQRQGDAAQSSPAPGRQAAADAPEQAGGRLDQVKCRRQRQQACPTPASQGGAGVERLARGEPRLHQRRAGGQRQKRQRRQQGRPDRAHGRQGRQQQDEQVPLRHGRQRPEPARPHVIDRLKEGAAPGAVVDAPPRPPARRLEPAVAVEPAAPGEVAGGIVLLRPLPLQVGLGPPVVQLLVPIGADGIAAAVPDHGGGVKAERPAALLQPPADVDVVAGDAKLGVEAADRQQPVPAKRHVAPGDVLGHLVGQQHVHGPAGRHGDGFGNQAAAVRRHVGPAGAGVVGARQRVHQVGEPVRVGAGVVVDVGDDLVAGEPQAGVAGAAEAEVLRADQADAAVAPDDVGGAVGRAVVHHDRLVPRVAQVGKAVEALRDRPCPVVRADHHGHAEHGLVPRQGRRVEGALHRGQRRLRGAVAGRESEAPVGDVEAAPMPLVGPREDECTRTAPAEDAGDLRAQGTRLHVLSVAQRVDPHLRHHQGAVAGDVVQAGDVRLQVPGRLQVEVEADEVEAR